MMSKTELIHNQMPPSNLIPQQSNNKKNQLYSNSSLPLIAYKIHQQKLISNHLYYLVEWKHYPDPQFYTWQAAQYFVFDNDLILRSQHILKLKQNIQFSKEDDINVNTYKTFICSRSQNSQTSYVLKSSPMSNSNFLVVSFDSFDYDEQIKQILQRNILKYVSNYEQSGKFNKSLHLKRLCITFPKFKQIKIMLNSYVIENNYQASNLLKNTFQIQYAELKLKENKCRKVLQKQSQKQQKEQSYDVLKKKVKTNNEFKIQNLNSQNLILNHVIQNNSIYYTIQSPFNRKHHLVTNYQGVKDKNGLYSREIAKYLQDLIIKKGWI